MRRNKVLTFGFNMALYNIVNRSSIKEGNNILAEHYQKERLRTEQLLKSISTTKIAYYFQENTSTVKASSLNSEWRVFDLPDTLSQFLTGGKNPSVEKVTSNKKVGEPNSFIISRLRHYLKEMAIVPTLTKKVALSTEYLIFTSKGELSPHILLPLSLSKYMQNILDWAQTGNAHPRFSSITLKNTYLPDVLIEKSNYFQQIIERAITVLDESKSLYNRAVELLENELDFSNILLSEHKNKYQSNISALISGRRFDPEYYTPSVVKVIQKIQSLNHTQLGVNFYVKNGFPWNSNKFQASLKGEPVIRIRDIKPTFIENSTLTTLESSYASKISFPKAKAGDVVIGMDGLKYFYASILEEEALVNQRVCHLSLKPNSKISSEYLTFIINSKLGQAQLLKAMTIATTVGHITNSDISKLYIPIISDEFHEQITTLIRSSINAEKESKQLLEKAKKEVETLIEQAAQTA